MPPVNKPTKGKNPFTALEASYSRLETAERRHEEARAEFYRAVKTAKAAGLTLQQIGDVCGLTRARISQIVTGE